MIGYNNINCYKQKNMDLREVISKSTIDLFCVDEIKLDASFPHHQFKSISGYQFSLLKRDQNSKRERKIVFVRGNIIVKQTKNF